MGAENRSGMREFQLRVGAGFCAFKESGDENRKGKVAGYGIWIFSRPHDFILCGMKCVGFQVMNRPRQSSLNVELVWVLLSCFVLISGISILVTAPPQERGIKAFFGLVCVVDFSEPFHWALPGTAMVSLAGMATPADSNVKYDGCRKRGHKFCCYILWKKYEQEYLSPKRTLPSRDFLRVNKDTESFEINC